MAARQISEILPQELVDWLGDVYPAWLILSPDAVQGLKRPPSRQSPLSLSEGPAVQEVANAAAFKNLKVLLGLIGNQGLILDADGHLTEDCLNTLMDATDWPNYSIDDLRMIKSPMSEDFFRAARFLREVAIRARLVRCSDQKLVLSQAGRELLANEVSVQTVHDVFETAFWHVPSNTLSALGMDWIMEQVAIILWGLSIAGDVPRTVRAMTRYCVIPPSEILEDPFNRTEIMLRTNILMPLSWFGLVKRTYSDRTEMTSPDLQFQKTSLFDRFLHFDVETSKHVEIRN